jgi:hypothetical protein
MGDCARSDRERLIQLRHTDAAARETGPQSSHGRRFSMHQEGSFCANDQAQAVACSQNVSRR